MATNSLTWRTLLSLHQDQGLWLPGTGLTLLGNCLVQSHIPSSAPAGGKARDQYMGPGWTRVITTMLTVQRAGKGRRVHEDQTGVPRYVDFPTALTKYFTKQPKERFVQADI